MAISADERASKFDAAARYRVLGFLVDRLIAELDNDPLEAFNSFGAPGDSETFDVRSARSSADDKKFARFVEFTVLLVDTGIFIAAVDRNEPNHQSSGNLLLAYYASSRAPFSISSMALQTTTSDAFN